MIDLVAGDARERGECDMSPRSRSSYRRQDRSCASARATGRGCHYMCRRAGRAKAREKTFAMGQADAGLRVEAPIGIGAEGG